MLANPRLGGPYVLGGGKEELRAYRKESLQKEWQACLQRKLEKSCAREKKSGAEMDETQEFL